MSKDPRMGDSERSGRYSTGIKALPEYERPRERLVKHGASNLSTAELLAIIMQTGSKEKSAIELSMDLLVKFGLKGLADSGIDLLSSNPGIGLAKACQLKAALELGFRLGAQSPESRPSVSSPIDAAVLVMGELRHLDREHFKVILLNTKNHVIAVRTVSIGTLDSSLAHPREVFKEAIVKSAASIILAHNHPSGDPEPSRNDIDLTLRLKECGQMLGIQILDHIIIGDNRFVSLKERNAF